MRIEIDPVEYTDAGTYLGDAGAGIHDAVTTLMASLSGTGAMAGTDTGGAAFAEAYDSAAADVVRAACTLPAGFGRFAGVVHQSAVNHARAEAASAKKPLPPQAAAPVVHETSAQVPPSAVGGNGSVPDWWHYIQSHVGGLLWPDADTGRLRSAGAAYAKAAADIDLWASSVSSARDRLRAQDSPEIAVALGHVDELDTARSDVARALRELGRECTAYADEVDRRHEEIWKLVRDTLRDLAITEGVLVLASVFTAGGSLVAGQAAAAAELANAGRAVVLVLRALETAARTANTVIKAFSLTAGAVERVGLKFAAGGMRAAEATAVRTAATESAARVAGSTVERGAAGAAQRAEATAAERVVSCGDPVDVVTGQVFLAFTDVELDGALPLVLRRRYRSGFDRGRFLDPHWGSTLDEHVEVTDDGAALVRWDTSVLRYPQAGSEPSVPEHGHDRWSLRLTDDGAVVVDPVDGSTYRFAGTGERRWLVRQEDRAGRWVEIDRREDGVPLRVRHHGGYEVQVTTTDGRVEALAVAGPDGPAVVRTFGYDAGRVSRVWAGPADGTPRLLLETDEDDRLGAWTDSTGVRYEYVYDVEGRCLWQGSQGGVMQFAYRYEHDPVTGRRATVATDPDWHLRRFDVDELGQVVAETDPLGATTTHAYDAVGRRVETADAVGQVWRWSYDEASRLVSRVTPGGRETRVERDEQGDVRVVVDPAGGRTVPEVDHLGRPVSVLDAAGGTTTWAWGDAGREVVVTDPSGVATTVTLDAAGLPVAVADALGGRTTLVRDAFGRVTEQVDALGGRTRLRYDVDGRPLRRENPDGTVEQWAYDGEGNLVREVDASGRETRYEYGPFDVLVARTRADGSRITLDHDAERRLVGVTNELGARWRYDLDEAGRVVRESDYDGRVTEYVRDAVGRVVEVRSPAGERSTFTYDAAGDLVAQDLGGVRTTLVHDRLGTLVRADGDEGVLEREHDALGRLLSETVDGRTTRWTHDAAGRVLARTLPSGVTSTWTYDAAGRRTGLDLAGRRMALERDPLGQLVGQSFGGGVVTSAFDALGRVTHRSLDAADHKSAWSVDYGYAPSGELLTANDSASGRREYALDVLGRIERVGGGASERYGYDAAGNLAAASWDGLQDGAGAAQGDRDVDGTLVRVAGRDHLSHDAAGRLVRRRRRLLSGGSKEWTFSWGAGDRLKSVTTPDGSTWRYGYDVLGRRVSKSQVRPDGSAGESVRFAWDGPVLVEQVRADADGGAAGEVSVWEHDGWSPVAQLRAATGDPADGVVLAEGSSAWVDAQFAAIITDLVGTPVRVVADDGALVWSGSPTVWGLQPGGASGMPLRFPGQYADDESGLHYNLFRYYDPTTARYVSPDPLGLAPSPNPFTYPANPTTELDPLGLTPCVVQGPARSEQMVRDLLATLQKGKNERVVSSTEELRALFERLIVGGERLPARGPKIPEVYRLPDGTEIQWRLSSKSGGETIDIPFPGGKSRGKIHVG